jgi:hypothetical protein
MDADENSSTKSKDSSTSILRNVSKRQRRGTLSGGDGTSSTTKQKITTAINQIVHRRASLSSSRPKELAGIISRPESLTQGRNTQTSPIIDKSTSQQQTQTQVQVQQQEQEKRQSQGIINKIRSKSPRPPSSHSSHHKPVSPTQSSFPLSVTTEEDSYVDSTIDTINDSINKNNDNKRPNSNSSFSSQKRMNSSLFTRDNKNASKDDRMEKLLKKAKNFLDHKQKSKSRVNSLWNFIGEYILFILIYIC